MKIKLVVLLELISLAFDGNTMYAADCDPRSYTHFTSMDLITEVIQNPPTLKQLKGIRPSDLLPDDELTEIAPSDTTIGPIDLYFYCLVESELRNAQKKQSKAEIIGKIKKKLSHSADETYDTAIYEDFWLPAYYTALRKANQ